MEKATRYEWAKPGDHGKRCSLHVNELKIDTSYQRVEVSERNTLSIARSFNWCAFGTIIVMRRINGENYIVDGQQRWLAAKRRGDISLVPCMLFESEGSEHEAMAFYSLNVNRMNVSSIYKFRARVKSKQDPELSISLWLAENNFFVTEDGKNKNGIDFPTTLINLWKTDSEASKEAIIVQKTINADEPLNSMEHKGLWYLKHNGIDIRKHIEKISRAGGKLAILRSIKSLQIETGVNINLKACGIGILRVINHKRRKQKIQLNPDITD